MKMIISGGGTGGHIFPAIAIADAIKAIRPDAQILFVGAEGRMEMERVPEAGYEIEGLPVAGFQRKLTWKNLSFPFKLLRSLWKSRRILSKFRPDVCVGVGGYASGPILRVATARHIPCLIQEQNSYAGVTNRLLGARVQKICIAHEGARRFFPQEKIVFTGNPVRRDLIEMAAKAPDAADARLFFQLDPFKKTVFLTGGSLGARTLNEALMKAISQLAAADIQVIWQCGRLYFETYEDQLGQYPGVKIMPFCQRMDLAYAAADLVVSRAGALSLSEICVLGKASLLIPSPNVAEDHQTANARSLSDRQAAVLLADQDAHAQLGSEILRLMNDRELRLKLAQNAAKLGIHDAAERIAREVIALSEPKSRKAQVLTTLSAFSF